MGQDLLVLRKECVTWKRAVCILWPPSWEERIRIKEAPRISKRGTFGIDPKGHVKGLGELSLFMHQAWKPQTASPFFVNNLK